MNEKQRKALERAREWIHSHWIGRMPNGVLIEIDAALAEPEVPVSEDMERIRDKAKILVRCDIKDCSWCKQVAGELLAALDQLEARLGGADDGWREAKVEYNQETSSVRLRFLDRERDDD